MHNIDYHDSGTISKQEALAICFEIWPECHRNPVTEQGMIALLYNYTGYPRHLHPVNRAQHLRLQLLAHKQSLTVQQNRAGRRNIQSIVKSIISTIRQL